jgi:serine/threonine protein kinase
MVAFYILTKGEHPFGEEPDRHRNLLDGNPVYLDRLKKDPAAKDLIFWMLSHDPKDRPSAQEALKHPYLQSKKQQFEMLCKVGNEEDILTGNVISDVVRMLNSDPKDWRSLMSADVLKYLSTDPLKGKTFRYKSSWTDCYDLSEMSRHTGINAQGRDPNYSIYWAIPKSTSLTFSPIFLSWYTKLSGHVIGKNDLTFRSTSVEQQYMHG